MVKTLVLTVFLTVTSSYGPVARKYCSLSEDVPGAGLGYWPDGKERKPNDLCVPGLKRWLACRGTRRSGKKSELVAR